MDLGLNGKVALVTGGSKGIGAAIALELAREGADVAICARDAGELEAMAQRIGALGRRVVTVSADLSSPAGVTKVVDGALGTFRRVDILVNNVGGAPGPGGFFNLSDADWQAAFDLNLMSAVRFSRVAARHDQAAGAASSTSHRSPRASPTSSWCTTTRPRLAYWPCRRRCRTPTRKTECW
jgi:3-oxoacyl-[acyl-carrier protein] reductase